MSKGPSLPLGLVQRSSRPEELMEGWGNYLWGGRHELWLGLGPFTSRVQKIPSQEHTTLRT